MFRKPFKVKSNVAIRGSERRKLRDAVSKSFHFVSKDEVSKIIPNKEDISVAKIKTHSEENITCYILNKNPILFEKDNVLYPSVYLMWEYPNILQLSFSTYPNVFDVLAGGADLMLPGVIFPDNLLPEFASGTVCYVTIGKNHAAIGVGLTTCSSKDILQNGVQGKRICITHLFHDHLWELGDKGNIPFIEIPKVSYVEQINEENIEAIPCYNNTSNDVPEIEKEENSIQKCEDEEPLQEFQSLEINSGIEEEESSKIDENNQTNKTPQEQMDELLENCFCQALLNAKKIELPILVSTFTSQYLYPVCPDGMKIDIKKTSYKKMSKFLTVMQNNGLVKLKELSKGVESIIEISVENEMIRKYRGSNFFSAVKANKEIELAEKDASKNLKQPSILIEELFAVSAKTVEFFRICKGTPLTSMEVRQHLTKYVKEKELIDQTNKKFVVLDPLLTDVLYNKNENYQEKLSWDLLTNRMLNAMNECHRVTLPGRKPEIRKGKMKSIKVSTEQRSGNKKVTIIKNLEYFGIDVKEFSQSLQHAAASSTTVTTCPGSKVDEKDVLVQGVQTKHIKTLLDNIKIPKKYIIGLESGGKQKKK